MDLAEKLLKEAALEHDNVIKDEDHPPVVRLEKFDKSSLNLKLFYHSKDLFRQPKTSSDIRRNIVKKFGENNVDIPYPIRTLQFPENEKQDSRR